MKSLPWFKLDAADYLACDKVARLKTIQEGAYLRLMCYAWLDCDCGITDNLDELAQMTGLGEQNVNVCSTLVRLCWIKHPTVKGKLINPRLYAEWCEATGKSVQCSTAGKASGKARRAKRDKRNVNERSTDVEQNVNERSTDRERTLNDIDIDIDIDGDIDTEKERKKDTPQTPQRGQARSVPDLFEKAREAYRKAGGRVDGAHAEYEKFFKACKKSRIDANEALDALLPAIDAETRYRQDCGRADVFCAPVANFSTWLYNRRWLQEFPDVVADGEPTAKEQAESEENRKWLDDAAAGKNDGKF